LARHVGSSVAQSLTIQAVLVAAWPSVAICSFHEQEH